MSVDKLLRVVERLGVQGSGSNIVAFSGGVDSSLVAALVHTAFPNNSVACTGVSASLPQDQLELARKVANHIGIELKEVGTEEGKHSEYVKNEGMACFYCKTTLYSTLEAIHEFAADSTLRTNLATEECQRTSKLSDVGDGAPRSVVLFNGTNKDDLGDPTRVGLRAAEEYNVASPLRDLTKDEVRQCARKLGLPNWNYAASPCLRSRLALGVSATDEALRRVEQAEAAVRSVLQLEQHQNMRVRTLAQGRAVVEVDGDILQHALSSIDSDTIQSIMDLGFKTFEVREFRSGSVNGLKK